MNQNRIEKPDQLLPILPFLPIPADYT